eukprot:UN18570
MKKELMRQNDQLRESQEKSKLELTEMVHKLEQENSFLHREVNEQKTEIDSLEQLCQTQVITLGENRKEIDTAQQSIKKLTSKSEELLAEISKKEEEAENSNKESTAEISKWKDKAGTLDSSLEKSKEKVETLR